jgi:predicted nucleic acid-binding protein
MNDLLIALTGWQIGAAVVTSNIDAYQRSAEQLPGLVVLHPEEAA